MLDREDSLAAVIATFLALAAWSALLIGVLWWVSKP